MKIACVQSRSLFPTVRNSKKNHARERKMDNDDNENSFGDVEDYV